MKKLGLDASTTTVGYAFVDGSEVIDMGFIPIQKEKSIRDKVELTMDTITDIDPFDHIDKIYIEDSLSGFSRGRTSQQTIIKLAKFNAVLTYCLEFAYGEIIDGVKPISITSEPSTNAYPTVVVEASKPNFFTNKYFSY